jgi:hypothetical protein
VSEQAAEVRTAGRLQAVMASAAEDYLSQRVRDDPEFAEDVTSLAESEDFITYPGRMTRPGKCEACGTPVTFVPEVRASARSEPETALWEPGQWRKHTPRRCSARRAG